MDSPDAHEPQSANLVAVIFDCLLIVAIAGAYFPQLRRLRRSTTGDSPSIDGLSPYYIFSHATFCSSQLSYALLVVYDYDSGKYTRFGALGLSLGVIQVFVQWLCAVSMVVIYAAGQSKEVERKLCALVQILIHAFFSASMSLIVIEDRHSLGAAFPWAIVCGLHYIVSPLALFTQLVAQSRELRERDDVGVLSLRSFALQGLVVFVLALRLIVNLGPRPFQDGESQGLEQVAVWKLVPMYAFEFWQRDHVSWNYIGWVGGAVLVWYKMIYRKDLKGRDGELVGLLE